MDAPEDDKRGTAARENSVRAYRLAKEAAIHAQKVSDAASRAVRGAETRGGLERARRVAR
jgi:hypothetical protein